MRIVFNDWAPDRENYMQPVTEAENVWPDAVGFAPALDFVPWALNQITGTTPNSTYGTRGTAGESVTLVGATSKIFEVTESYTADITTTSGITGSGPWDFTTFRDNVIAVRTGSPPIATPLTTVPLADFAAVTGSPPGGAETIGYVRDFLVLGATLESGTKYPNRVRWSGFNNFNTWGSDLSTQADFQDMRSDFGEVRKIVAGTDGYIFQEDAITRMSYVGPPVIFRFDQMSRTIGAQSGKSVVWSKDWCFFYSKGGFKKLDLVNGQIVDIGLNRVDEWFRKKTQLPFNSAEPHAAIDVRRQLVFWAFRDWDGTDPGATVDNDHNTVLIYHYELDRWAYMLVDTKLIGPGELSNDIADIRDNSTFVIQDTDTGYDLGFFDGFDPVGAVGDVVLASRIKTGIYGDDNQLMYIDGSRPIIETNAGEAPVVTSKCNYRNNLLHSDQSGTTGNITVNSRGRADFRVSARYVRFDVRTTGKFRRITGLEYNPRKSGGR